MPKQHKRYTPWWVIALIVFLCLIGAFAAAMGVYKLTEAHSQPVPGRLSPSTSISR